MAAVDWLAGDKITAAKLLAMEVGHLITPSVATTVANTATETEFAEFLIPANTAETGMCWRMRAWGNWGNTGTPTLNVRLRVGSSTTASSNTAQATTGAIATVNGAGRLWMVDTDIVCESTGATGALNGPMHYKTGGYVAGNAPFINDVSEIFTIIDGVTSTTINTTVDNYVSFTATWGTANALNSFVCVGFTSQKLVG